MLVIETDASGPCGCSLGETLQLPPTRSRLAASVRLVARDASLGARCSRLEDPLHRLADLRVRRARPGGDADANLAGRQPARRGLFTMRDTGQSMVDRAGDRI